jgi:cell division septation protein DedD
MVFFVICLLALGLSYFFGLMTGLSSRRAPKTAAIPTVATPTLPAEPAPTPARTQSAGSVPSLTRIAEGGGDAAFAPTAPAVLQAFEDRGTEEPTPGPTAAAARPAAPGTAGIWIQVASLTARREADALVTRLSRRGYHAQVAPTPGPKGQLYRVRVGPYRNEEDARRGADKLRRMEKIGEPWIVRDGH